MAKMTDLYLGAQGRLYEVGKILKDFCDSINCPVWYNAPDRKDPCNKQCALYGLGDKLLKESVYASAAGLIRQEE